MVKRMLIDAGHAEETRVVVASGTRLEEFDFESAARKQLKGNVYLAKVMRVEPSLQAAFVDYGGNRHGFLPFSEIHPDYYQIPVADREALYAEHKAVDDDDGAGNNAAPAPAEEIASEDVDAAPVAEEAGEDTAEELAEADAGEEAPAEGAQPDDAASAEDAPDDSAEASESTESANLDAEAPPSISADSEPAENEAVEAEPVEDEPNEKRAGRREKGDVETLGGDELEEYERRRVNTSRSILVRRYKIQEVIKKRQIMLVQVVKEERGNKGAALTTYLSLAGRYCVLMPNAIRGGGISRKIVNAEDRKRLKAMISELSVPPLMSVIVRTAGVERSKPEIRRDFDYLLRQWENIRELTLQSTAPILINEEANLIKRSIRDLYSRDIDEILVEGEEGYKTAKSFMKTLIPSHTAKVQPYRDRIPLFARYQIEGQLDSMYSPEVQLRSGGYLVINPTEALVSIDVNSGRATKERNIEETALKTNMEAAEEIARQLRLRDLAGLIVIDFIDMEENRNQRNVERRVKDAMRSDRARIQLGRISPFGLMELSRQRLRPSLLEASMERCHACDGAGIVRSVGSSAVYVLRAIEEEGLRSRSAEIAVHAPAQVALYILNEKRKTLADIEERYNFSVMFKQDDTLVPPMHTIERLLAREGDEEPIELTPIADIDEVDRKPAREAEGSEGQEPTKKRRRRRRKSKSGADRERQETEATEAQPAQEAAADATPETPAESAADNEEEAPKPKRRRRGKRGGRRRSAANKEEAANVETGEAVDGSAGGDAAAEGTDESAQPEAQTSSEGDKPDEEKPARRPRRRSPRRRSKAKSDDADQSTAATNTDGEEAASKADGPEEEPALAARSEPAAKSVSEPDETVPDHAKPIEVRAPVTSEPASAISEPVETEPTIDPAHTEDSPPRRGWWQKLTPRR